MTILPALRPPATRALAPGRQRDRPGRHRPPDQPFQPAPAGAAVPWLKDAFNASYTELGFLMTIFFVVSCAVQALSGFLVDRFGPRPILFGGLALVGLAASAIPSAPATG
jgi:hypothetical protein